jgi:DNA-directed RNA polymerase subunit RPC12/RpoP
MKELSFIERVKITQDFALRSMEHPGEPLNLSKETIDFFGLNLVEFHDTQIPQCSSDFFKYFLNFLEDNPGINSKNIGKVVSQLIEDLNKIPDTKRPKNERELENKIKKISGRYLANSLITFWKLDAENLSITNDEIINYFVVVGVEFSMIIQEIFKSYWYDVRGNIPPEYRTRNNTFKKYLRTYLCIQCGEVFFSKSNNSKYCPGCAHKVRMDNQSQRRNKDDKPGRCLYCRERLPLSKTKPKKYCNDECRYADRKKS